jgi:hypothetical protein
VYYHQVTREYANRVATLISQCKDNHAKYPTNIDQVGISKTELRKKIGVAAIL